MRAPPVLLPASAAALALALIPPAAHAAVPTSYIDVHLITSFASGSFERGFLFRISASESTFAGHPPKGPRSATRAALTGGAGTEPDHPKHTSTQFQSSHPSHRLMLPPAVDEFLCNEATGAADYRNPAGNAASGVLDPDTKLSGYEGNYILVPRGHCSFEAKARSAQRLGAAGVIVRNTLDSRYELKPTDEEGVAPSPANGGGPDWRNTKWPEEREDYECGTHKAANRVGWRAEIDVASLAFSPAPYDGGINNALLTGPAADESLCAAQPNLENFAARCPSKRCLLTGRNATDDGSKLEACCAWDLYERMGADADGHSDGDASPEDEEEPITIAALFVTMENGEELYDVVVDAAAQAGESVRLVTIVPYQRWYPSGHYSSIIVWALALLALWIASYESAKEYRTSWKKIKRAVADGVLIFGRAPFDGTNATNRGRRDETVDTVDFPEENIGLELELAHRNATASSAVSGRAGNGVTTTPGDGSFTISDDDADADDFVGNDTSYNRGTPSFASVPSEEEPQPPDADVPPQQRQPQRVDVQSTSTNAAVQNLEINALHAVLIVVCASCFLFVLFFFKIDKVIRVLYGLGGSVAMNQIIFYPLYVKILLSSKLVPDKLSAALQINAFGNLPGYRGEYFRWIDVLSAATSFAMGIAWIVVGLTRVQPMTHFYYWFLQDLMGVCFCIFVLGVIHINTIMIASVLLFLVFLYDVFHVLISPLIFGSSVMVDVAMGSSRVDPQFCEKYPSDKVCRGAFAPLPMLFAIPWFNDFRGGFSMLGLGDIILPGLLISFAARYDAATSLVRKCSQVSSSQSGETAANAETDTVGQVDHESGADGTLPKRYHYRLGRIQRALFHGYFGPLVIAYGFGLMIAYLIVWSTKSVQPALLYLVPTCLGTILFLGWRRRELSELWSGPKVMRKADRMVGLAEKIPEPRQTAGTSGVTSLPASSTMV